jgi:hypothetical protein
VSVKGKVEKLERAVPVTAPAGEPCEACEAMRGALAQVYGARVEPFTCTPGVCDERHRNLLKVYGA